MVYRVKAVTPEGMIVSVWTLTLKGAKEEARRLGALTFIRTRHSTLFFGPYVLLRNWL